jgi:hypothetical protein
VIRLGSLAGYPFEGPRLLAGWSPPATAAVYAVLYRADPDGHPYDYAVIDVDHSDDLAADRIPSRHPRRSCWEERAGDRFGLHICTYEVPGGTRAHREQIARELIAVYAPGCRPDQYDQRWEDDWIGSYRAPTTGPLTTRRDPNGT